MYIQATVEVVGVDARPIGVGPGGWRRAGIVVGSYSAGVGKQQWCAFNADAPPTSMPSMATSPSNFQSILDAALDDYHKHTGIDLTKHPSAAQLQNCHSPDDVVQLLLERETSFKDYREKYRKLIDCLRPVVKVVHALSGILGEGTGLVSDQH